MSCSTRRTLEWVTHTLSNPSLLGNSHHHKHMTRKCLVSCLVSLQCTCNTHLLGLRGSCLNTQCTLIRYCIYCIPTSCFDRECRLFLPWRILLCIQYIRLVCIYYLRILLSLRMICTDLRPNRSHPCTIHNKLNRKADNYRARSCIWCTRLQ